MTNPAGGEAGGGGADRAGGADGAGDPVEVPGPVALLVDSINQADVDRFVAAFAPDGFIDDWGRTYRGPDGIRSWALSDAIGAGARMRILSARTEGAVTSTRFLWRSSVFTGESVGEFTVAEGTLQSFVIRSGD
jgi:hypothetical protein